MQRTEIHWSPNDRNQLAEIGAEIIIHTFDRPLSGESGKCLLGGNNKRTTSLNYPLNEKSHIKSCAWWPSKEYPFVFAIGQPNGRIIFENVKDRSDPWSQERIVIDSKQGRSCLALSWNCKTPNLLLSGFDKSRPDSCIVLWDINHISLSSSSLQSTNPTVDEYKRVDILMQNQNCWKPLFEYGSHEMVHSLTWFKPNERLFAASMSQHTSRTIKIFDPRASPPVAITFPSKAPYNLCADSSERYLSASIDKSVYVYDSRSPEKALIVREEQEPIVKLSWSRTGSSHLGYCIRDSPKFHLLSISPNSLNENDSFNHRILQCPIHRYRIGLSSFDWNHFDEDRLVLLGGKEYFDYVVPSRSTINYSVRNGLLWTDGHKINPSSMNYSGEELSSKVIFNYDSNNLQIDRRNIHSNESNDRFDFDSTEISRNTKLTLDLFQRWIKNANHNRDSFPFVGVIDIFREASSTSTTTNTLTNPSGISSTPPLSSTITQQSWSTSSNSTSKTVYDSNERQIVLQLCGWPNNIDLKTSSTLNYDRLNSLIEDGFYEKAAAICIFQMDLSRALEILNNAVQQGNREDLATLIIALIGSIRSASTSNDDKCLFNEYSTVIKSYQRPYLRAMFSFIFTMNGNDLQYQCVLDEQLDLNDKVAFAARYLNDQRLYEKLDKLSDESRDKGDLQGILLTGLRQTGCDLIQRYLDQTNDIRTAAFLGVYVPEDICQDCSYVHEWIEGYRYLLDKLQMWNERAEFDIYRRHLNDSTTVNRRPLFDPSTTNSNHHQNLCVFCQNSLDNNSSSSQILTTRIPSRLSQSNNINRTSTSNYQSNSTDLLSVCNKCRQNLPRCSICMMSLTSYIEDASYAYEPLTDKNILISSQWFTWCRMCRHGGHAEHVSNWFLINEKCPVARCSCRCTLIDGIY